MALSIAELSAYFRANSGEPVEFLENKSNHATRGGANHGRNWERNGVSVPVMVQNLIVDYQHVTGEFLERENGILKKMNSTRQP